MQQLGELQKSADQLRAASDVFVINNDTPEDSRRLKRTIGLSLPVLLDRDLQVARSYDMLPKANELWSNSTTGSVTPGGAQVSVLFGSQ